jgi:DNA helicase-2/ATP-dependent DNA helicase PcrA
VLWLSDGHFPSASSLEAADGEEEERRLFYVAVTRAKQELYLCHVFTHIARDRRAVLLRESIFLAELSAGGLREEDNPYESWELEES